MKAIPVASFERHNTCLHCGYDLFGQPRTGVCPECGTSTRESARNESFIGQPGNLARLRSGAALLLWSSILSGFCPGVCLLCMYWEGHIAVAFLMTLIFVATALTAALGERRFEEMRDFAPAELVDGPVSRIRRIPDFVAAAGLMTVNLAAYVYSYSMLQVSNHAWAEPLVMTIIGVGFLMMAATAWRAVPSYALRADIANACLGTKRRGFKGLGMVKAIYETIWLSCCWGPMFLLAMKLEDPALFLAFGALFGLGGFAILWILMIIFHAILFAQVRKMAKAELTRGFEVNASS